MVTIRKLDSTGDTTMVLEPTEAKEKFDELRASGNLMVDNKTNEMMGVFAEVEEILAIPPMVGG